MDDSLYTVDTLINTAIFNVSDNSVNSFVSDMPTYEEKINYKY